jgi:hypothetical protein
MCPVGPLPARGNMRWNGPVRLTPEVDVPESLLTAAIEGNLVLFVGAGASYDAPSSLPLFDGLAEQVGALHGEVFEKGESADAFLGQLEDLHPVVRDQVQSAIQPDGSSPNTLHHAIARLAAACAVSKVVTTNFDEHISAAARAEGLVLGETFNAPAVPLGRSFEGVVHLHGAVSRSAKDLVFTDADFGRAYLTDGWARRFVQDLFISNVVLFVGYSHDDTVMKYLARGLPPETKRYALATQDSARKWASLKITPVFYPSNGDHAALGEVLDKWASHLGQGLLDQRSRVADIVTSGPPKLPVEADYLSASLGSPLGVRTFVDRATGPEWLVWAEQQEPFVALFQVRGESSESKSVLATWFVNHFLMKADLAKYGLRTLARLGPQVSADLANALCSASLYTGEPKNEQLLQLTSLTSSWAQLDDFHLDALSPSFHGTHLRGQDLLRFFRRGLRFRLTLREVRPWSVEPDEGEGHSRVEVSSAWSGRHGDLDGLWEAAQEDLDSIDHSLLQILEQAVRDRHEIESAFGANTFDKVSWGRSAIEPHGQDRHRDENSVVIDALRDCSVRLHSADTQFITRWLRSGIGLLERLGVHLLSESNGLAAGDKVRLIVENNLLYSYPAHHEVFRFLQVVAKSLGRLEASPFIDGDERLRRRVEFDRLEWLRREVDDWQELDESIDVIREGRPEIGVREHPDMDHWMSSGTWGGTLPWTVEEFLALADDHGIETAVEMLLTRDYSERNFDEPDWDSAMDMLRQVVETRPSLGPDVLATIAVQSSDKKGDVTSSVFQGLSTGNLAAEILDLALESSQALAEEAVYAPAISSLLLSAVEGKEELSETTLQIMDRLAKLIWESHATSYTAIETTDWMSLGLNSWPGYLARYWLSRVSRRLRDDEPTQNLLTDSEASVLAVLLEDQGDAGRAALSILANQLYFLFAADPAFTADKLIPLFSASAGARAQQAWNGYLYNPRVTEAMLESGFQEALVDAASFAFLAEDARLSSAYWDLASVVFSRSSPTMRRDEVLDRLVAAGPAATTSFFSHLASQAEDLSADEQAEAWSIWVEPVRRQRLGRLPGVETVEESAGWSDFLLRMSHVFPDALHLSMEAPAPLTDHSSLRGLAAGDLGVHGDLLADVLTQRVALISEPNYGLRYFLQDAVQRLKKEGLGGSAERSLLEACLRAGFSQAADWVEG